MDAGVKSSATEKWRILLDFKRSYDYEVRVLMFNSIIVEKVHILVGPAGFY